MLSPGKYHLEVPKTLIENLKYRRAVLRMCEPADPNYRQNRIAVRRMCETDFFWWLNVFGWQRNPRRSGHEIEPFISWDFQDNAFRILLDSIECHCGHDPEVHQHDLLWEKSREMGATWMFLFVAVWLGMFHRDKEMLMISRSEKAVEDESPNSLFWKIDFIAKYIPKWLTGTITRRAMFIGYDRTGSSIVGEASTGRAGVGGRATVMFIDEFSQIKEAYEVLHRTSDTTGCRVFNGTHKGVGTAFHELSKRPDMRKVVMHWSQHPRKNRGMYKFDDVKNKIIVLDPKFVYPPNFKFVYEAKPTSGPFPCLRSPWYDNEVLRKGSLRAAAEDLDIAPEGADRQYFDPVMIRQLRIECERPPDWVGDINYDRITGRPHGIYKSPGGPLKLWLHPSFDGSVPKGKYAAGIDASEGVGATPTVLCMGNSSSGEKILEYAVHNIRPDQFGVIACALGWTFCDHFGQPCFIAWEQPGPGLIVGKKIIELGYGAYYSRPVKGKANSPGWHSNRDTKRELLSAYQAALYGRLLHNPSEEALKSCLPWRYSNAGEPEHPLDSGGEDPADSRHNHGEHVIADALMWLGMLYRGYNKPKDADDPENIPVGSLAWRRAIHAELDRKREAG